MKFFEKNWISKFFFSIFEGKKISITNFLKFFFTIPQFFFLRMILNTQNGNYMKV